MKTLQRHRSDLEQLYARKGEVWLVSDERTTQIKAELAPELGVGKEQIGFIGASDDGPEGVTVIRKDGYMRVYVDLLNHRIPIDLRLEDDDKAQVWLGLINSMPQAKSARDWVEKHCDHEPRVVPLEPVREALGKLVEISMTGNWTLKDLALKNDLVFISVYRWDGTVDDYMRKLFLGSKEEGCPVWSWQALSVRDYESLRDGGTHGWDLFPNGRARWECNQPIMHVTLPNTPRTHELLFLVHYEVS